MDLFDRLVKKENQTATIPLVSDIPPYVDNCKVVLCNERGLRHVHHFGNVANKTGEAIRIRASQAVSSFSFQLLHLARERRRKMTARNVEASSSRFLAILQQTKLEEGLLLYSPENECSL